jgi:3-deoxy-D-manno-octulosonic-acid transferase
MGPTVKGRFGQLWGDRLGWTLCGGGRPLWLHGASVGEAISGVQVFRALRAGGYSEPAVLSAATPAGLRLLRERLANLPEPHLSLPPDISTPSLDEAGPTVSSRPMTQIAAPPLDFWGAPARFLDRLNPRVLVLIETEIWPELICQCSRRSIEVVMLSARLSERSHRRLARFKGFCRDIFRRISLIAAISQADRDRFTDLGAAPETTFVAGSAKFDDLILLAAQNRDKFSGSAPSASWSRAGSSAAPISLDLSDSPADRSPSDQVDQNGADRFRADESRADRLRTAPPVLLAGSTHPGEEKLILSAARTLSVSLALAPRHIGRAAEIAALCRAEGFEPRLYSETKTLSPPAGAVTIVDVMGVLASLYEKCDLALVGGSFLKGAGHNPLEPAAFGKPVVFGSFMSSFQTEADDLRSLGAAFSTPAEELGSTLDGLLADPKKMAEAGWRGLSWLAARTPVAETLAQILLQRLQA